MSKLKEIPTSEIANFLGVNMPYVSNMKAGRTRVSGKIALKLHEKFGIPLWEIRPDIYPKSLFLQSQDNEAESQ